MALYQPFNSSPPEDQIYLVDNERTSNIRLPVPQINFSVNKMLILACGLIITGLIVVIIGSVSLKHTNGTKIDSKIEIKSENGLLYNSTDSSTDSSTTVLAETTTTVTIVNTTESNEQKTPPAENGQTCTTDICKEVASQMKSFMDETYDPCNQFFKYSCGGWINNHAVPEGSKSIDVVGVINIESMQTTVRILKNYKENENDNLKNNLNDVEENGYKLKSENDEVNNAKLFDLQKRSLAGDKAYNFYISCINQNPESDPLGSWLDEWLGNTTEEIDEIWPNYPKSNFKTRQFATFIKLKRVPQHQHGKNVIEVTPGGLTLPLNYYLDEQESNEDIFVDYLEYLTTIKQHITPSDEDLRRNMKAVIDLEKKVALITPSVNPLDEDKVFLTVHEMQEKFPYLSWEEYFSEVIGLTDDDIRELALMCSERVLKYLKDIQNLLTNMLMEGDESKTLKTHQQWQFLKSGVKLFDLPYPKSRILQNALALDDTSTINTTDQSYTCAEKTQMGFPQVIGRLFVLDKITKERSGAVLKAYEVMFDTYTNVVKNLSWIDEKSKEGVLEMFGNITFINGFPLSMMYKEKTDILYRDLNITNNTYFSNAANLISFSVLNDVSDIENEVTMANAFFRAYENKIMLLAAAELKPFFDYFYPMIINYARLGSTIGHEMTHAFQFYCNKGQEEMALEEEYPTLTLDSYNNFLARRNCVDDQYSDFRINGVYHVDGETTLDENFSDIGGLQVAYKAYMDNHGKSFENLPDFDNYTQSQIFFIAAAQVECRNVIAGDEGDTEIQSELKQSHSPNSIRVLGSMTNNKDFAKAFNCPLGALYNLKDKCDIFSD